MSIERALAPALVGIFLWAVSKSTKRASPEIQRLFERFHDTIKLEENDGRLKLRTKRELLLKVLREKMAAHSLSFEAFDQGSYAMRTGVVPKDGNYDIDVGLVFDCPQERFRSPVKLKLLVHDALAGSNRTVSIRRACVTVTYHRDGVPDYHVDLALYLKGAGDSLLLAKGKMHSQADKCEWATAAPRELTQYVLSKFSGDEQAQFRRCIRYLKRWRDEKFTTGAPVSVALTVAAAMWFRPTVAKDGSSCDLAALHALVKKMKSNFGNNLKLTGLVVPLPGVRDIDLMSRLSAPQMTAFKKRLSSLDDALSKCYEGVAIPTAAAVLRSQFGIDFPAV